MLNFSPARRVLVIALLLFSTIAFSGCVYRPDVQQGNEITKEMLDKVEPGMSRREVIRVLGYPLINDPFNRDRWDYYYSLKSGKKKTVQSQSATLVFEGDSLKTVDSRLADTDDTADTDS